VETAAAVVVMEVVETTAAEVEMEVVEMEAKVEVGTVVVMMRPLVVVHQLLLISMMWKRMTIFRFKIR